MPTYTYTCTDCNDMIEKRQSFSDPPLTTCERCGGALRKVIHPVGIVFKGSGWYITDSRSSTASSNGSASSSSESKDSSTSKDSSGSGGGKDSTTTSSKPATSETKPSKSAEV